MCVMCVGHVHRSVVCMCMRVCVCVCVPQGKIINVQPGFFRLVFSKNPILLAWK